MTNTNPCQGRPKIGLRNWETWAMIIFLLAAGAGAGYPLGQWHVRQDAILAVAEIRQGYQEASDARMQTLNLCLSTQGKAVLESSNAAKVAGEAAKVAAGASETAAKAVDAAKGAVEAAKQR